MIQKIKFSFILVFLPILVGAQANNIIGIWLTEEGDSQIEIFKATNSKYYGRVVWLKTEPEAKDDNNPNPSLRNNKIQGLQILRNFSFSAGENEWTGGTIYDPNNGNTYDCYMWFDGNTNNLKIKGFVMGMRFLGRETTWTREKFIRTKK